MSGKNNSKITNSIICFLIFFAFPFEKIFSQLIPSNFIGVNAWMPDSIGTTRYNGKLHQKWGVIKNSGARIIRYGGSGVENKSPTPYQYLRIIDSIQAKGMEPIIQVPFHDYQFSPASAANIVYFINVVKHRNVHYWSIGNEPDNEYGYTSSNQVSTYIKIFASAMKAVDTTILILGPELSWYNPNIMRGLVTPGGSNDITGKDSLGRYYVDLITFHGFAFNGTQTRENIISLLTTPGKLQDNLVDLKTRLDDCNSFHGRIGGSELKIGITEANVNWQNTPTDGLFQTGSNSFIGGQYWADLLGIAMKLNVEFVTFWSAIEGQSIADDLGYLDGPTGRKEPSYYHFQMIADNLKGTYCKGIDNQPSVKAFGSKDSTQIVVMVLNQDEFTNFDYILRLDTNLIAGNKSLKINIDAALVKEYSDSINKQSSILLFFDTSGNLRKKCEYKLFGNADHDIAPSYSCVAPSAFIVPSDTVRICKDNSVTLFANMGKNYVFQWKKNSSIIVGARQSFYTANTQGNYSVDITLDSCTSTSAFTNVSINNPIASITPSGSVTICSGSNLILNANTGSGFSYQWKKNNINIVGATASSYTAGIGGDYSVEVIQQGCSAISAATKIVTTFADFANISPPGPISFPQGSSVVLNASEGIWFLYQWRKNGTNIIGSTNASYTVTSSGDYQVGITNSYCFDLSPIVSVNVTSNSLTATITPSGNINICSGKSITLKANTGTGLSYQWKKNGLNISGAKKSSYTTSSSGSYAVAITKGAITVMSVPTNVAKIVDNFAVIIPSGSIKFRQGGSVVLLANTGIGFLYQWRKNGSNIKGATNYSYTATTAGDYQIRTTNSYCIDWSAPVKVRIIR